MLHHMNEITQAEILQRFTYKDGKLLYRKSQKGRGSKRAGDEAGTPQPNGYRQLMIKRKRYLVHRLIWLYHHGELPECLDHINRDRSDNRIENLRSVTRAQNTWNRDINTSGSSKYTGVCWTATGYVAYISHHSKRIHLGYFETEEEAALAYNEKAKELRGEFAVLNEVECA